jgi:hypothetical protein
MRLSLTVTPATVLLLALASTGAAQDRPYTEGPVIAVSYIRIKPGMFDKYVKYLDGDYKKSMEAAKKEGVIVDYGVFSSPQEHDGDWNMVLTVTYKSMAALDNLRDKMEPIQQRVLNLSPEQAAQGTIERAAMREQIGGRLLRQLTLK